MLEESEAYLNLVTRTIVCRNEERFLDASPNGEGEAKNDESTGMHIVGSKEELLEVKKRIENRNANDSEIFSAVCLRIYTG